MKKIENMYQRCLYHCPDCTEDICQGVNSYEQTPCPQFITQEMLDNKEDMYNE